MGWCDDPESKQYNKLIKLPFSQSKEKLYRKDNIYDLILILNYNMDPVKIRVVLFLFMLQRKDDTH